MPEAKTPEAINDCANAWVIRLDRGELNPVEQAEFDAWLGADRRHRGALLRAGAIWEMTGRARVLAGSGEDRAPAEDAVAFEAPADPGRRRLLWGAGALAASIAAGVTGLLVGPSPEERIETAVGEIRRVPLADGSVASVNTATRLGVRLEPDGRDVRLERGEAWFQVAKDKARPFVVSAGDVRVRAVGTAFSVRRTAEGAEVQVTEGEVEVWSVKDPATTQRVAAGSRAFIADAVTPIRAVEAPEQIERALSWRGGQLIFDGDTLDAAAAEFNRYNRVQLEIGDPALGAEKVVGRFRVNEPDAFAEIAASMLGAEVETSDGRIRLSRK